MNGRITSGFVFRILVQYMLNPKSERAGSLEIILSHVRQKKTEVPDRSIINRKLVNK